MALNARSDLDCDFVACVKMLAQTALNPREGWTLCQLPQLPSYHDREDTMWKLRGVHLRLYLPRYDRIFEETSPITGAPQDHEGDG